MKQLQDLPNLSPEAIELLQASGYTDVKALKDHTLSEITEQTRKTNEILNILTDSPTKELLTTWLSPLGHEVVRPVRETDSGHIIPPRSLLSASFAIPLSEEFIAENAIVMDKLLPGTVKFISEREALKHMSREDLEIAETDKTQEVVKKVPVESKPVVELKKTTQTEDAAITEAHDQPKLDIDDIYPEPLFNEKSDYILNKDRIIDMETFRKTGSRIEPLVSSSANDLIRSTKKETNEGVNPSSRRYIKGVLHNHFGSFMISTGAYLSSILLFISAFPLTSLLLVDKNKYWWAIFSPLLILSAIFIYFAFTNQAFCPICRQKQYALKSCLKHRDAHYWGLLGYMLPTAIHALLFKWFRCIFCGTPIRLKK